MKIRITLDGRLALTVEQAAARYGLAPHTITSAISRLKLAPDAWLDGRKKLYLQARLDEALRSRPGKGANWRKEAGRRRSATGDSDG